MSARKSWDITPKAAKPAPARRPVPVRRIDDMRTRPKKPARAPASQSTRNVTIARARKERPGTKEPLRKRRKKARTALIYGILVLIMLALGALAYLAWLPVLRISAVDASGPHAAEAERIAREALWGTHAFVLPRNSLFFIPEADIRARILAAYPDIESVSFKADGLNALVLTTSGRAEAFLWCGEARGVLPESCYSANAEGLVFAAVPPQVASTSEALRVYGARTQAIDAPIAGSHILHAERIPESLRFVKALQMLGADVTTLVFREDEADLFTRAGTRITYVLGREQEAAGVAASVFPQLSLNDGSIAYVDLRFSGKAYFKRANDTVSSETESEPAQ